MLIDWFTVIAQVINFLILVYLLKRFLYKPILNAIDEREKRIAAQLQEAETQKTEAQNEHMKFQQLNEDFAKRADAMLAEAEVSATTERQHLLENARKEYEQLRSGLQESLKSEHANLGHDLKSRAQREVFEIVRRVISDLAGTSLEAQIAHVFVQKLQAIGPEEKAKLMLALHVNGRPVMVRSAFDLDAGAQTELENSVKNLLGEGIQVQFGQAPEEVGGIELSANGFKINWTIADYLDSLEKRISELQLVQQNNPTEPQPATNGN